jgi:hypothetical protein
MATLDSPLVCAARPRHRRWVMTLLRDDQAFGAWISTGIACFTVGVVQLGQHAVVKRSTAITPSSTSPVARLACWDSATASSGRRRAGGAGILGVVAGDVGITPPPASGNAGAALRVRRGTRRGTRTKGGLPIAPDCQLADLAMGAGMAQVMVGAHDHPALAQAATISVRHDGHCGGFSHRTCLPLRVATSAPCAARWCADVDGTDLGVGQ